jgi:hypothetical protein
MTWYKTGTITVTNGSPTITGAGTLWVDVGTLNPGDILTGPDGKLYEILSISSNTGITLASNYLGGTLSAQAYSIMPIGLLPSTLAQAVKSTLATANTALASTVRYDINTMGLTLTQQQNARTNIAALSALDVGAGALTKSVAGGVDVTLTAVEASAQYIVLTGALTASINVIVPAAARVFYVNNATSGAFTVTVKTPAGSGAVVMQGLRAILQCDGGSVFNSVGQVDISNTLNLGQSYLNVAVDATGGAGFVSGYNTKYSASYKNVVTGSSNGIFYAADHIGFHTNSSQAPDTIVPERLRITSGGDILGTGGGGIGYGVGSGGAVTQATSKSTLVALNKPSGLITMNNAALAAGATVNFQFNNSVIGANDTIFVQKSGGGTDGAYNIWTNAGGVGACIISVKNISAGSLSEALVIKFDVFRGASA